MNQSQTLLQRVASNLKSFGHHLIYNTNNNPNLVCRDHRHLSDPYRRTLTAPDVAIGEIGKMLFNDPHFSEAVEKLEGRYLVRACIVGVELRANVYRLDRYVCGLLTPMFSEDWRDEGIVQFGMKTDGFNHTYETLVVGAHTDLSYDYFEPCLSYLREISDAEDREISRCARLNWREVA